LEEIKKNAKGKLPFATGTPFKVGEKLKELDFSIKSQSGSDASDSERSDSDNEAAN
jgi:hypothetical protein